MQNKERAVRIGVVLLLAALALVGCGGSGAAVTKGVAVIQPLGDSGVQGVVTFTKTATGIKVQAELTGLTPGIHGFHIHAYGDCSAPDGKSVGGHYNPGGKKHGPPDAEERHVGDLGNLKADATGKAVYTRTDSHLALTGPESIIGRAVIIHGEADDLVSQPSGNAGPRVACGVIGIGKE